MILFSSRETPPLTPSIQYKYTQSACIDLDIFLAASHQLEREAECARSARKAMAKMGSDGMIDVGLASALGRLAAAKAS